MRPIKIIFTFTFMLFATTGFAAENEKVDICHFDLDYGVWKLINISDNAIEKHLENHDDGLPESETLGTGTPLDENCEVMPACPCWTGDDLRSFDVDPNGYDYCGVDPGGSGTAYFGVAYVNAQDSNTPGGYCTTGGDNTIIDDIEIQACANLISAEIADRGLTSCGFK